MAGSNGSGLPWTVVAGVVLIVAAPCVAVALAVEGPPLGLLARAPTPVVGLHYWPDYTSLLPSHYSQDDVVYVPTTDTYVFTAERNLTIVDPSTHDILGNLSFPCWLLGVYYPGSGTDTYSDCVTGFDQNTGFTGASIVVLDTARRTVAETVSFGSSPGCGWDPPTLNPSANLLYCRSNGTDLLTVNLSSKTLVGDVPLVGIPRSNSTALLFDPFNGDILVGTSTSTVLSALDPLTGQTLLSLTLPGLVDYFATNPTTSNVYVSYDSGSTGSNAFDGVAVVDPRTLALTWSGNIPDSAGSLSPVMFSAAHDEAYVQADLNLYVLDEATNRWVAGPLIISYLGSWPSFDPTLDTFATPAFEGPEPYTTAGLLFASLVFGSRHYDAFTGVPWLGTSLPLAVGVIGFVVGVAMILVRYVIDSSRERRLLSRKPPLP